MSDSPPSDTSSIADATLGWVVYNHRTAEVYGGRSSVGETVFEKREAKTRLQALAQDPNVNATDADLTLARITDPTLE